MLIFTFNIENDRRAVETLLISTRSFYRKYSYKPHQIGKGKNANTAAYTEMFFFFY